LQRKRQLSPREVQCLRGLACGLDNAGIARALSISLPTVALHLSNARKKLQALTREQAVARAVGFGLIGMADAVTDPGTLTTSAVGSTTQSSDTDRAPAEGLDSLA